MSRSIASSSCGSTPSAFMHRAHHRIGQRVVQGEFLPMVLAVVLLAIVFHVTSSVLLIAGGWQPGFR